MQIKISAKRGVPIAPDMIGLFFEDINYAGDGGLYAELLENRSFAFYECEGDARDYSVTYDGGYAWSAYPDPEASHIRTVMGSPLAEENPHYMRVAAKRPMAGLVNQCFDGLCLEEGKEYHVTFWARCVKYTGKFCVWAQNGGGAVTGKVSIRADEGREETYNFYRKYELTLRADRTVRDAVFVLCMEEKGIVEFAFVSLMPADAVAGVFRKDLFEMLKSLHPGFLRFPGGCIVEGNTLVNRYRYKDTLKPVWTRKNNWNRWAVHGNCPENDFRSRFSHYNQSLGLGFYEYFLLCELIGAKAIPVLNVGFACQYQSLEQVGIDSPEFVQLVQDAIDLIEFANGSPDTVWGGVRAQMGHEAPFGLTMLGIGNEQWQTQRADFFERYTAFEKAVHAYDPDIRLIGSAGPDITSEHYTDAWKFYNDRKEQKNFVYAVDEHYYVRPQWLLQHTDFYDDYSRDIKVFSGEYAAHPVSGLTTVLANTLEGALAEAAFLTGVERNADVVVLASYAPLFAREGYTQWAPDMIWFDGLHVCATPSYYVQKMYAENMGDTTLDTEGLQKEAEKEGVYYSLSYCVEGDEIILKIVNSTDEEKHVELAPDAAWGVRSSAQVELLTGNGKDAVNSLENPDKVVPVSFAVEVEEGIRLPANSFAVVRL